MDEISVVKNLATLPSAGKHVADQECKCRKTSEGYTAISLKWESPTFFSSETWLGPAQQEFVFVRDAFLVAELPEKHAKSVARAAGFVAGAGALRYAGLLTLLFGAIGASTAKTRNIKGIAVIYRNEEQKMGIFDLVSSSEIVDTILASISPSTIVVYDELKAEYRKNKDRKN